MKKLKNQLINLVYFIAVFIVALSIATLSVARQLNSYQSHNQALLINVEKKNIYITSAVSAYVEKIHVYEGQRVKKGDLLLTLNKDSFNAKLDTLKKVSYKNISAKTEASVLETKEKLFEIRAPQDGIIYSINIVEGVYVNSNSKIITMLSNSDIRLVGEVDTYQFNKIKTDKKLDAYNTRTEQIYEVNFEGVNRIIPASENKGVTYEVSFSFVDPSEGSAFFNGENFEIISQSNTNEKIKPVYLITNFWNNLIIGSKN